MFINSLNFLKQALNITISILHIIFSPSSLHKKSVFENASTEKISETSINSRGKETSEKHPYEEFSEIDIVTLKLNLCLVEEMKDTH